MATQTRLKKHAELKAKSLTRNTFGSFFKFVAIFLSVMIGGAVVMSLRGAPSELPISFLMFLGQGHILIPVRPVSTEPKQ